jgi:hypothetical protein
MRSNGSPLFSTCKRELCSLSVDKGWIRSISDDGGRISVGWLIGGIRESGNRGIRETGNQGIRETGNQGIRETGNQGIRESGNQGIRESGNQGIQEIGNTVAHG